MHIIFTVYSVNTQFCPSTFQVGAKILKKIKFYAYKKSRKPYQKASWFCDWQFFHAKEVWKSKKPRDAIQTLLNEFKRTSTGKVRVAVGFLLHTWMDPVHPAAPPLFST